MASSNKKADSGRAAVQKTGERQYVFSPRLTPELESRILQLLDLRSLAACREVDSIWRNAVDDLRDVWSRLAGRLGVAKVEQGNERQRAQRLLGDCWLTSSTSCVIEDEAKSKKLPVVDATSSKLTLLNVSVGDSCDVLKVVAYDPASLSCRSWKLRMRNWRTHPKCMGASMPINHDCWLCMLRVETLENSKVFKKKKRRNRFGKIRKLLKFYSNAWMSDESLWNSSDSLSDEEKDKKEGRTLAHFDQWLMNAKATRAEARTKCPNDVGKDTLYAIVPLHRRRSGDPVVPVALIRISSKHRNIGWFAVHKCDFCSELQLVVLSNSRILLFNLPPSTDLVNPPSMLTVPMIPTASMRLKAYNVVDVSPLPPPTASDSQCGKYFGIQRSVYGCTNTKAVKHASLVVRINCQDVQAICPMPQTYFKTTLGIGRDLDKKEKIVLLSPSTALETAGEDKFGWDKTKDELVTGGKMQILRFFMTSPDRLDYAMDTCEYAEPFQTYWFSNVTVEWGRKFWYCIGTTITEQRLLLAIYRTGCPNCVMVVELNDLLGIDGERRREFMMIDTASNWTNDGLEPDSVGPIPLIMFYWSDDVTHLLSLEFGPQPKSESKPESGGKCKTVRFSRNCL